MKKTIVIVAALVIATQGLVFAGGASQGKAASTVELSAPGVLPITKEKSTLDTFFILYTGFGDPTSTNTVIQDFEAATNVHLNMTLTPGDGAKEKLNLLYATGQYPEVIIYPFYAASRDEQIKYGTEAGTFLPLNDLIDQHAPTIKKYFTNYPWTKEAMTLPDGKIYGIPSIQAPTNETNHGMVNPKLWINTVWLDKLGLKIPTTTEEYRTVLRAFKTQDPNGNGRADEIGLSSGVAGGLLFNFLFNAFGYYDTTLAYLQNDKFVPIATQDYIREGLIYMKSLYDEGLIDPAGLTQTDEQMSTLGSAVPTILGSFVHLWVGPLDYTNVERSKSYTAVLPLKGPSGYQAIPVGGLYSKPTAASFVITDKCKNPALAIKVADAFCTVDWTIRAQVGKKGAEWIDSDPGAVGMDGKTPAKYKLLPPAAGGTERVNIIGWMWVLLQENIKAMQQVTGDLYDPANLEARLVQETVKYFPYKADVQEIPLLNYSSDVQSRQAQISAPLSDYMNTSIVEFISGARSITTGWDAYKREMENLGYSEYISNMQKAYDATKK